MNQPARDIINQLLSIKNPARSDLERLKVETARRYSLSQIPRNSEIISELSEMESEALLHVLRRKESRGMSGVSVIAIMTKPYPCPHGRCAYCPGGPDANSPQSYTGFEPAAARGKENEYDPAGQVRSRIRQLESIGHRVDKIDLIIMGGTFPASPREYQEWFVKEALDAVAESPSANLAEAKLNAENCEVRNVGITVETRPDCVSQREIDAMLDLGVTRVELGVQIVYDDIYRRVERGHCVQQVVDSTRLMKDAALKICYHMMPGLPGSDGNRDLEAFRTIFTDPRFKPDMIKIYPTLVVEGTKLHDWWRSGDYKPLTTDEAASLVAEVKRMTPPWVRIMRVQRDIPLPYIAAGVDKSNLRQLAEERLHASGGRCRCIRCREVGHSKAEIHPENVKLVHAAYEASGGEEEFISAEDPESDALIGFLRLRIPGEGVYRPEIDESTGLIRELHVYGQMVPVGDRKNDAWQHTGWGEALMAEAEKTAAERYGMKRMVVISALGTKQYYGRLGYSKQGPYVSKQL